LLIQAPVAAGGIVFFVTFQPGIGTVNPCSVGESFLNAVNLGDGSGFDLNNDEAGVQSRISLGGGLGAAIIGLIYRQVITVTSENVAPVISAEDLPFSLGPGIPVSIYILDTL